MLTALTSLSLFIILVGAGKLMYQLPGESYHPAAVTLGIGVLLVNIGWQAACPQEQR